MNLKMKREHEIERIKQDYKEQWPSLEKNVAIQKAITDKDPIKLRELAAMLVYGNFNDRGVAHQAGHPVIVFVNNEAKDFDEVESAKTYIIHQKSLNPTSKNSPIFKQTKDGVEIISN
jgi:hypothetical protein